MYGSCTCYIPRRSTVIFLAKSGHNAYSGKTAGFIKKKVCSSKKQSTSSYKGIGVDSAGEK